MPFTPRDYGSEAAARAAVVAEALTWLGTPWRHRAKVKRAGVDCGQFPLAVYAACGLVEDFDTGEYARDHMLHSFEERMLGIVQSLAAEIEAAAIRPGDVILYRFGRVYSHAAIVTRFPQVIHPMVRAGCVCLGDHDRDADLAAAPQRYFSHFALKGAS